MTSAEKAFFIILPPRNGAHPNQVQSDSVTTSAANTALWSGLAAADRPKGKVVVTFEARGADVYVRFKSSATAAATTTSNGLVIKDGTKEIFYLDPTIHTHVDHIGSAAGAIKWYVSSPPQEMATAHGS